MHQGRTRMVLQGLVTVLLLWPLQASANAIAVEGLSGSTRSCTIVELYPGYRGNITGLMPQNGGVGDYACLQDLEDARPRFSQAKEDRANRRAGKELGTDGSIEDWTWETWLQIEVERGLVPQCYACLIFDTDARPLPSRHQPDIRDPRLLVGLLGSTEARDRIYLDVTGRLPWSSNAYWDDYVLRAQGFFSTGSATNAPQLLDAMYNLVEESNTPGGSYYTFGDAFQIMTGAGGYVPTSELLHPEDQVFILYFTMEAGLASSDPNIANSIRSRFNQILDDWTFDGQSMSLSDYIRKFWEV